MKQNRVFSSPASPGQKRFSAPKIDDLGSDSLRPVFSFEYITDKTWGAMQKDEKSALAEKLFRISKFSCRDLRENGRNSGSEYLKINEIKCPSPDRFKAETGAVVFHMSGNVALVCFKTKNIHYIIEIDRNFKAYNHG